MIADPPQHPKTPAVPMIVAHRGASRDAPENTLPAFQLAWDLGADAVEGDFRLTRDGVIVCIHDADTQRVSGKRLVVGASDLADLRRLEVGTRRGGQGRGAVIPTAAEVFAMVPVGKKIYVEIKTGAEIVSTLLDEIDRSGLNRGQVVIICFDSGVVREVKHQAPQLRAFWLSDFKRRLTGGKTPDLDTVLGTLADCGADGFSSSPAIPGLSFIRQIMARGYEYHVWTVDDPETARRFARWGAQSITTNVPGTLLEHMRGGKRMAPATDRDRFRR